MLPICFRIRSEYFENDSSRYRLAITQNTLSRSLKYQTDRDFTVSLNQSPMDPCWTRRRECFCSLTESEITGPRIEVEIGDDDFLCPGFVESIRKVPYQKENSILSFPNGYIFSDGKLRVWRGKENIVSVTMFVDDTQHIGKTIEANHDPSWIYVRHSMNSNLIPIQQITGTPVNGLSWKGWKESLVAKYCRTEIKMATSNGCTLHPRKSKSMTIARDGGGARRR